MEEEEKKNLWDARSGLRTGLGLGFEVGANTLLDVFSFEPTSQVAGGTFINYLAQKIRGGEISKGELAAAGLTSLIPGGAQARAITRGGRLATSVAKGGLSGGITSTSMSLLDEGRLPTAGEIAGGVGLGGAFGGMFDLAPAAITGKLSSEVSEIAGDTGFFLQQLKRKVQGGDLIFDPEVYYGPGFGAGTIGAARPIRPVDPDDTPKYELSELIIPKKRGEDRSALAIMNASGMVDGRLDIDVYKTVRDREAVAIFLTPRGKGVPFDIAQKATIASLNRKYGPNLQKLGLSGPKSLQAHHNVPLKASLPAFHGLVKDSPKFDKFMQLYYNELLSLGDMPKNIVPALGDTLTDKVSGGKKYDSPHYLIHKFIRNVMGEDGLKFWTPDELDNLVVRRGENGPIIRTINDERRTELIKEQIGLFKRAQDILKIGMEEYRLLGSTEQIMPEEIVEAFTNKLPTDLTYEPGLIKSIVREIAEDTTPLPKTSKYFSAKDTRAMITLKTKIVRDAMSGKYTRKQLERKYGKKLDSEQLELILEDVTDE